jgi:outer membrane lipoprotein SlyB
MMFNRILLAGVATVLVATFSLAQPAQARDGHRDGRYDRRVCDDCGRVIRIESIGQRRNHVGGGTVLGALVGGALGNQVGKGDGRKAATIAGAVAGGVIGHNAEKNHRRSDSYYRIVVRMDRGRTRTYEQAGGYDLRRGDRVRIENGYVVPTR